MVGIYEMGYLRQYKYQTLWNPVKLVVGGGVEIDGGICNWDSEMMMRKLKNDIQSKRLYIGSHYG